MIPTREPWPARFPDVVIHSDVRTRDAHPSYAAAKSGDHSAALAIAAALVSAHGLRELTSVVGGRPAVLLPVVADEDLGFNAIPDAMAHVLAASLGWPVSFGEIVQVNKVGHTRAKSFQRIVAPAAFEGHVDDADYLLVDDHVGLGGTLANLRGHIEARGGRVIAMTTLTESRDGKCIAIRDHTRNLLWDQHGQPLENLWRRLFGHGFDSLTELEAVILAREKSVAAIEDRLAQGAVEARSRGIEPVV